MKKTGLMLVFAMALASTIFAANNDQKTNSVQPNLASGLAADNDQKTNSAQPNLASGLAADNDQKPNVAKSNLTSGFDASRPNMFVEHLKYVGRYALLYIPNRLIDATDIVSIDGGFGGEFSMYFQATKYFELGGGHGSTYFLSKGYSRQYGGGYRNGTLFGLFFLTTEDLAIDETFGYVNKFVLNTNGFSPADYRMDAYRDDDVDFWSIGGRFGWLITFGVGVHPVEIADLVSGVFCYDLKTDDLK